MRISHVVISLCLILMSLNVYAEKFIDSKKVKASPFYNGKYSTHELHPYRYDIWLEIRAEDDEPKDIFDVGFIIDDPKVVQPLYSIVNKLLSAWPGRSPDMAIFVLSNPGYSGMTMIANELLISTKVLSQAKSDDELAAILAHELSHILLQHNKRNKIFSTMEGLFDTYETVKMVKEIVEGTSVSTNEEDKIEVEFDEGILKGFMQASAQKRRASEFYDIYDSTFFKRSAELEADKLAVDLLAGAGYSIAGLSDSLDHLASSFEVETLLNATLTESANTLAETSLIQLTIALNQHELTNSFSGSGELFREVREKMTSKLKKKTIKLAKDFFTSSHPVPAKRIEKYLTYMESYGKKARRVQKSFDFITLYQEGTLRRFLDNQTNALTVYDALAANDYASAETLALSSIKGPTVNNAFTRTSAFQVRFQQDKFELAELNIERIDSLLKVPNYRLVELGTNLLRTGNSNLVLSAIQTKERIGGSISHFYPLKIEIAISEENQEEAKTLAMACVNDKHSSKKTRSACNDFQLLAESEQKGPNMWRALKEATSSMGVLTDS